jgi:hypothetical protein
VNGPGWPSALPYLEIQGEDPGNPPVTDFCALHFIGGGGGATCVGVDSPIREVGTITIRLFSKMGGGDAMLAEWPEIVKALAAHGWPTTFQLLSITSPKVASPGGAGGYYQADIDVGYQMDHPTT